MHVWSNDSVTSHYLPPSLPPSLMHKRCIRVQDDLFVDDVGGTTTSIQGTLGAGGGAGAGAGRNGGSARVSGVPRGGGVGELAALVANTNPGYHDYMSEITPRRRGSEAFG